ncbi:MAG: hypothetical protein H0W72_09685 [Planctomycetes bacterium]|nr:hypothetical protein [Planctomycetota bacterium]
MAEQQVTGRIATYDDQRVHRREWFIERVGWAALIAFTAAAALGVTGSSGPLNRRQASAGGLVVDHHRFIRHQSPYELRIRVPSDAPRPTVIAIDRTYLDGATIAQVVPAATSAGATDDRCTFTFAPGTDQAVFQLETSRYGAHAGSIGVLGGPEVRIDQFIWP